MQILKNVKRMTATILSVATCLTPSVFVSANDGNKVITIQRGEASSKRLPLVYNDDYFSKSSFEYNGSLATASLALELAGFANKSANKSDYSDQAKNAKQALEELGFEDIEENDDYKRKAESDTIGVVAANKKIKSNNEEYTLVPVVIRGGGYDSEWAGNAKVGKTGDHEGFDIASTKAKQFVDDYISKTDSIQGKVKIWIVGYSRGGATAGLMGVKFNKDITKTLDELNKESQNCSNEEYYNRYIDKEKVRTLEKYRKKIEINPNDLYVYTFESPMAMNILNGSGLQEYEGNIPCSKLEKKHIAIYNNIHNIINDDDFVTKVAPKDWGFARPGVEHKLLEGRKDSDIRDMESILHEFLINKVSKAKWDKKSDKEKKESKEYEIRYVGNRLKGNIFKDGIRYYSEFSDRIIDTFNRSITRARGGKLNKGWQKMTNREFFATRYQETFSKLASYFMSDKNNLTRAKEDIWDNCKADLARIIAAAGLNTNYMDAPFNNIVDRFSQISKINFSAEERQAILDLLKGLDHNTELPFFLYIGLNGSAIFKMHQPELHLATLISKDKNKKLYIEQIKNISKNFFNGIDDVLEEYEIADGSDEFIDYFDDAEIEKIKREYAEVKEEDQRESKKEYKEESKKNIEKKSKDDGFFDVTSKYSIHGINRALAFENQQKEKKKLRSKSAGERAIGMLGKGLNTGVRFITSPIHETKNIFGATKDFAGHMLSGWSKWLKAKK